MDLKYRCDLSVWVFRTEAFRDLFIKRVTSRACLLVGARDTGVCEEILNRIVEDELERALAADLIYLNPEHKTPSKLVQWLRDSAQLSSSDEAETLDKDSFKDWLALPPSTRVGAAK
jgi:hypothetical protein